MCAFALEMWPSGCGVPVAGRFHPRDRSSARANPLRSRTRKVVSQGAFNKLADLALVLALFAQRDASRRRVEAPVGIEERRKLHIDQTGMYRIANHPQNPATTGRRRFGTRRSVVRIHSPRPNPS